MSGIPNVHDLLLRKNLQLLTLLLLFYIYRRKREYQIPLITDRICYNLLLEIELLLVTIIVIIVIMISIIAITIVIAYLLISLSLLPMFFLSLLF